MPDLLHGHLHSHGKDHHKGADSAALNDETNPDPSNPNTGDDQAYKGQDGNDTGLEKGAHMSNNAAPGSHSALFGLSPKDGPDKNKSAGAAPDSEGEGGTEAKGVLDSGSNEPGKPSVQQGGDKIVSTTGGMDKGSDSNELPGAGGSMGPSQGSGRIPEKTDKGGYVP